MKSLWSFRRHLDLAGRFLFTVIPQLALSRRIIYLDGYS